MAESYNNESEEEKKKRANSSTVTPDTREKINNAILEALSPGSGGERVPIRWPSGAVTYERKGKRGGANFSGSYTNDQLRAMGANKMGADWSKTDDPLRGSRLDAFKEKNKSAQAEDTRRQGIRDSNSVDISKNIAAGLTGRQIFQDNQGRVEGPAELKARLMKEGADIDTATIAAGERYRDMFDAPNSKPGGFGMRGGQRDAVINAKPEDRMGIMAKLKDARADNLKGLTEQRLADPNRKPVGITTSIQSSDGRVLAKRGEGEAVVARGGTQGAMGGTEDRPGPLTLTEAGENAIRDRVTVNKTEGGDTVATGRYGTAMSGPKSMTDQLKDSGMISKDFQLTPEQKTGQAALPKEYAEGRDKILAEAGQAAKSQGTVVGDAKPLLDRMAPGTAQAIDQKSDKIAADLKQQKEDKLGSDFLTAYKNSGGTVNQPKPGAESPGPRTDQEKADMQAFLDKKKEDDMKRRLMAKNSSTL